MKCKQKSCNRNKNLLDNGFCNVCNEAIMDTNEEHNAQKVANEAIIKDLVNVNERLRRGEVVDQNLVNSLIMEGIISLVTHKDVMDEDLEARIINLEVDRNISKSRSMKHDERIKEVSNKAEKDHEKVRFKRETTGRTPKE